jgi:hypothetical protein
MLFRSTIVAAVLAAGLSPAFANDTTAQLATGGLIFVRNDVVSMESEDLFISMDEVRVDYEFRNGSDEDVVSLVAFPMPDIEASPYFSVAVPWVEGEPFGDDNFLHFTVEIEGEALEPQLEQTAFAAGLDVTDELLAQGISPNHLAEGLEDQLAGLDETVLADWIERGIVANEWWEDEDGVRQNNYWARWTLRSTYYWQTTFPAGRAISVSHRYRPSVGGTAGVTFLEADGSPGGFSLDDYTAKYCMDASFLRALGNATRASGQDYPPFTESWISYVLKTGANWAGSIGRFRLVVDKGKESNFISFCGTGVKKIGPTTFEMRADDFYPERDLHFLIMQRHDM